MYMKRDSGQSSLQDQEKVYNIGKTKSVWDLKLVNILRAVSYLTVTDIANFSSQK